MVCCLLPQMLCLLVEMATQSTEITISSFSMQFYEWSIQLSICIICKHNIHKCWMKLLSMNELIHILIKNWFVISYLFIFQFCLTMQRQSFSQRQDLKQYQMWCQRYLDVSDKPTSPPGMLGPLLLPRDSSCLVIGLETNPDSVLNKLIHLSSKHARFHSAPLPIKDNEK